MARTSGAKAAGLDLLDRLYRNQILVHLVFSEEERSWLARLCARVGEMVRGASLNEHEAESLRHWTYCMLEIYLADRWGTGLERCEWAPPVPANLSLDIMSRVAIHDCNYFARFSIDTNNSSHQSNGAYSTAGRALELALGLIEEFRDGPPVVRQRLAERALAFEFPDAPLQALQWLSSVGVLKPAKYSPTLVTIPVQEALAVRAALLCEFETIRSSIAEQVRFEPPVAPLEEFVRQMRDIVGAKDAYQVHEELLEMHKAHARLRQRPSSVHLLGNPQRCFASESSNTFLAECHRLTPYLRTSLHKVSNAVTDIAAVLLVIRKARLQPDRALYASVSKRGTIADDVSSFLRERGFSVDPKTIYRHVQLRVAAPLHVQTAYRDLISIFGLAWPAHWPELVRPMEIAHARTLRGSPKLEFADSKRTLH